MPFEVCELNEVTLQTAPNHIHTECVLHLFDKFYASDLTFTMTLAACEKYL